MSHVRVIPRDLFNEAKLLKCVGKVVLWMHDGRTPPALQHNAEDGAMVEPFRIEQSEDDGSLSVANLSFNIRGRLVSFRSSYNSKEAWPLIMQMDDHEWEPINEDGSMNNDAFAELDAITTEALV